MRKNHQQELSVTSSPTIESKSGAAEPIPTNLEPSLSTSTSISTNYEPEPVVEKNQKLEKAKRKKEKQKEKERLYKQELAELDANAGPSLRRIELELLDKQLTPLSLAIVEIPSDGNCLYRAVAAQCGLDYIKIRKYNPHSVLLFLLFWVVLLGTVEFFPLMMITYSIQFNSIQFNTIHRGTLCRSTCNKCCRLCSLLRIHGDCHFL